MDASTPTLSATQQAMKSWFGGRIPIVLGIVGHRDLSAPRDAIARAVRRECRRLRRDYRRSPFLILSGLAEGADRIIARVAMDELGARLIAILPFPPSEFCADFVTEDSRQEFSELLNEAAGVFEVTRPSDENWKTDGEARDVQYARVGAVIAEQSQILIALWDGRPARGIGGTAHVVEWFERGYAPPDYSVYKGDISLFDPPQPGLCIRIDPVTAERDHLNAQRARRPFGLRARPAIREILRRTDTFNRDVQREAAYRVKKAKLVPPELLALAPISEAYAAFREADALSIFYADRVHLADWVLYTLVVTAVFAFSIVDVKPLASWAFLGTMGLMAIVASYVASRSLDTRFQEYRSFAEAMRILFFWRMLGLKRQVWLSYLSKHGAVVRWLRHAVRAIEFAQDCRSSPAQQNPVSQSLLDGAIQHWLGNQIAYFKRSVLRHERRYWWGIWIARAAIVLTFATSALLALMTINYGDGWHAWRTHALVYHPFGPVPIEDFIQQLQIAVSLTAALGITARAFLIRSADLDLMKQYSAAREIFETAEREISKVPPGNEEKELPVIFERLGREALLEQAEWLWLRHSRPFEAPTN